MQIQTLEDFDLYDFVHDSLHLASLTHTRKE